MVILLSITTCCQSMNVSYHCHTLVNNSLLLKNDCLWSLSYSCQWQSLVSQVLFLVIVIILSMIVLCQWLFFVTVIFLWMSDSCQCYDRVLSIQLFSCTFVTCGLLTLKMFFKKCRFFKFWLCFFWCFSCRSRWTSSSRSSFRPERSWKSCHLRVCGSVRTRRPGWSRKRTGTT